MVYTLEERQFIIEVYNRTNSYKSVRSEFNSKFNRDIKSKNAIYKIVNKWNETGSVLNRQHNRTRTVLTEQKLKEIDKNFADYPRRPLHEHGSMNGVSVGSMQNAVKLLGIRDWKTRVVHQLQPEDYPKRIEFCNWFKEFAKEKEILDLTVFSDEAWFHLCGFVSSSNMHYWAREPPNECHEVPLHSPKIGVWCGLSRRRIYGPIFFEKTIDKYEYERIIHEFIGELEEDVIKFGYFQQDGASPHRSDHMAPILNGYFADRIITLKTKKLQVEADWPPRSPDLTPLDFYLWGDMKKKVYKREPNDLNDLKKYIEEEINKVSVSTLHKVFENMDKRIELCIANNGQHFQHLLRRKKSNVN